jgi:hypothetical protein
MVVFIKTLIGITGRRIGSRRFSCRPLSKVGEGWIKSGMGMARYVGVVTCLISQCKQDVHMSKSGNFSKITCIIQLFPILIKF